MPNARRRIVALSAIGLVCAVAYGFLVALLIASDRPEEIVFEPPGAAARDAVGVYLDLLAIDPVRESLEMRVDLATGSSRDGPTYHGAVPKAVTLRIGDGFATEVVRFPRGASETARDVVAGADGSPAAYPFDRYSVGLDVRAEVDDGGKQTAVPVRVTVFTGVENWRVRVARASADADAERRLAIAIDRPPLQVFLACVVYCVVATIGLSALSIAALCTSRARPLESSFITALVAMSFTIPALRGILPGAPAIGVVADAAVLLVAEVAVAGSLAAVVALWHVRSSEEP